MLREHGQALAAAYDTPGMVAELSERSGSLPKLACPTCKPLSLCARGSPGSRQRGFRACGSNTAVVGQSQTVFPNQNGAFSLGKSWNFDISTMYHDHIFTTCAAFT